MDAIRAVKRGIKNGSEEEDRAKRLYILPSSALPTSLPARRKTGCERTNARLSCGEYAVVRCRLTVKMLAEWKLQVIELLSRCKNTTAG
jgi:hypothetical protein